MAAGTQSKIESIEDQIKRLQEKKKREIAKLEKQTGKRFLEKFNLANATIEEINDFMDQLYTDYEKATNKEMNSNEQ